MSETAAIPQITGKLFLFEQPEILNKEQHGALGITPLKSPFSFCAKVRAAPVTVNEIAVASRSYPIIFTSQTNLVPLAVLGVIDDVNLFVNDNGEWDTEFYAPGYLRRYPFAFASESNGARFALVLDRAYSGISEASEQPFFENGQASLAVQNVIEFCKSYETDRLRTEQMMKKLGEYDLIAGQAAQVAASEGATPVTFAQYFGIDVAKFEALSDEKFLELRKSGLLSVIYAQIFSNANWRSLFARRARRFNLTGEAAFSPVKIS